MIRYLAHVGNSARPRRYPHDPDLNAAVDYLQIVEDKYRASGDLEVARVAARARSLAASIALGVRR